MRSIWLMYHDVRPDDAGAGAPYSAAMYHVTRRTLAAHLEAIRASGKRVVTAGEFLDERTRHGDVVVITFDDGWAGSFEFGIPLLKQHGWRATFFVTRDFVGRPGFCSAETILRAADSGMEIGVHGTSHRMLSSCGRSDVLDELDGCKQYLEDLLAQRIEHGAAPGGGTNRLVIECARNVGLRSLSTSRPGVNTTRESPYRLKRLAVRHSTRATDIARFCHFGVRREVLRWTALQWPREALGMKNYARIRRWILDRWGGRREQLFQP